MGGRKDHPGVYECPTERPTVQARQKRGKPANCAKSKPPGNLSKPTPRTPMRTPSHVEPESSGKAAQNADHQCDLIRCFLSRWPNLLYGYAQTTAILTMTECNQLKHGNYHPWGCPPTGRKTTVRRRMKQPHPPVVITLLFLSCNRNPLDTADELRFMQPPSHSLIHVQCPPHFVLSGSRHIYS